ncbi:GNAT family N-acetyltransferase [Nocardiopsis suaedae]|uniref:GNAT family N-acetyltransferase n=1 Tax=Nocardiopsis suaedae TaxID=3018444 RepID=A0ABT4TR48_9ACTN|nr:GNAT family N-acetyltransferase [Nocardiopsis suaedae]MDA2807153.1 GNAT family N-acetyltransferase [Nocardiopsis suaedae]
MRDQSAPVGPVFPVPYLPTLGPVHPAAVTAGLWEQVLANNGTGRFLAHDPASRWGGTKNELVLHEDAAPDGRSAGVAVLCRRRRAVTVYHYAAEIDSEREREAAAKLAADHGAESARLLWLTPKAPPVQGQCRRIWMKTLSGSEPPPAEQVQPLNTLPPALRATWPDFADATAGEGFAALEARRRNGPLDGPLLVVTVSGRIAGAIGPMAVLPDPVGRRRLLPQYFAVLPGHRGQGLGRALWRAAMAWGAQAGADYQLLQTELGGASDRLCEDEALQVIGFATAI